MKDTFKHINAISGQRVDLFVLSGSVRQHDICYLDETHTFHLHAHPFYEFLYILEGSILVCTEDGSETLASAGEIAYVPKKCKHIIRACPDSPHFELIRFNCAYNDYSDETIHRIIHLEALKDCIKDERKVIDYLEKHTQVIVAKDDIGCLEDIKSISDCLKKHYIGSYIVLCNLLCNLFVHSLEVFYPERVASDFETVTHKTTENLHNKAVRIANYIEEHCTESLHTEDIATQMNYSKRQIQRIVQNYYGVSVSDLIKRCRVDRITQYIKDHPEVKNEELLSICGYSDTRTMNAKFKDLMGLSTSQYASKVKNGEIK